MSEDHTFIDLTGDVHQSREMTVTGWTNYLSTYPDYMIHLSELNQVRDKVIMIGTTMGSHLQIPRKEEFGSGTIIWAAKVKKNLVVEWLLFDDNEENRRIPGATLSSKIAYWFLAPSLSNPVGHLVGWQILALPTARSPGCLD